jgi:hypothetical protein
MSDRVPSFFFLVPGPWQSADEVVSALRARGIESTVSKPGAILAGEVRVDLVEDERLGAGPWRGRNGALAPALIARIGELGRAALIEYGARLDQVPRKLAALGRALRDAGGLAVRMEGSGATSTWEPWLERLDSEDPYSTYVAAVLLVRDEDVIFTCGMHQFDLPDAQIAMADAHEATVWLDTFCAYQIAETPALASGHTFRPDAESTARVFERWPDHRHVPDDGRHNPFGVWRFLAEGQKGVEAGALVPTIMPALIPTLLAAESSKRKPLTEAEVEAIVAKCTAVALEPRDVLALERSRGYADIEPELAWEQWQIVRRSSAAAPPRGTGD